MGHAGARDPGLHRDETAFRAEYPAYDPELAIEPLRASEYARVDAANQTYLDYTASSLYADSQVRKHLSMLERGVFGNPHSSSPASRETTSRIAEVRQEVLSFFNADPGEYCVIFTANASHACRLVGESFQFGPERSLLLLFDSHNSVNGIREFARRAGAAVRYSPLATSELRVDESSLENALHSGPPGLFGFPAQSNFSGVQHDLEWIPRAQELGWTTLLDSAAFVPTNPLDLSRWHPDFIPLSFYKMFGYPTGVGALLARHDALRRLHRPWFAGGTVWGASVQGDGHVLVTGGEGFEDGTPDFLSLPAIGIGLRHLKEVGLPRIHDRVQSLTDWLISALLELRHTNGTPVVSLYGPASATRRGGTIALNILDPNGSVVDERIVDLRASALGISLRTGCFCNPGAGEAAFNIPEEKLRAFFHQDAEKKLSELYTSGSETSWDAFLSRLGMASGGAVRVSFGIASNFADARRFLHFTGSFTDQFPAEPSLPPRLHC